MNTQFQQNLEHRLQVMPVQTKFNIIDATRNILLKSGHVWSIIFPYKDKIISEHTYCNVRKALLTHTFNCISARTRLYMKPTIIINPH